MSIKPVIVYGASGYTGRLIMEYLRNAEIPFTAAGRNKKRIEEALRSVPGIETADYDILEIKKHDVEDLTNAFRGRRVVCNVVGPFITRAATTLEAALNAGIHYIDTTGEQASIIDAKRNWGQKFGDAGLVCAPATSYMYVPSEITAHLVLETPGIDTLDGVTLFSGIPTFTSTQSIYVQLKEDAFYLEDNILKAWSKTEGLEVSIPGFHETKMALPWGGTGCPVWFEGDRRVRNAKVVSGVTDRGMMQGVLEMQRDFEENIRPLPADKQLETLLERAGDVQQSMPPRENPNLHRTYDSMMGRGNLAFARVALLGVGAYFQTGLIQAMAATHLVNGEPNSVGFSSPCQAFGYQALLDGLVSNGLTAVHRF